VALLLRLDVLRHDFDSDFHRRRARVIDRRQEGYEFAHMDRLAKDNMVHTDGDNVARRITAGTRIGHLIEQLQQRPAMDIAGKIRHVRRHQHRHGQLM